ncbi:membrane fusion protein, multidrug efflux system [Collimonas sp. OK607]|uniref:efflux RND transporter periplasmic adaptor subunit n=1 Tax=Collimonas sp. OK607 TaxID=1798194 RepID=UPI0008DF02D3|nr:efflux RND transporter periplasmic adaptor subunit [Collimonas sp. OK607]SFA75013.1 membrane fusion protein, multidrug efflux system [Collimonas sp. OK607]
MQTSTPLFSRKAIAIAVGILVLAAAGTFTLTSRQAKAVSPPPAAVSVSVAAALEKSVTEWDDFSGRVEAIERVEIRPRVSGTIDAVHFQEGQLVKKGDLLFTIDPRPYQAELARAVATQAGAQAGLALAKTELARTNRLIEEHAVAQRELDQRNNALLEADASLKAADAAVQTARLNLQYTSISAPVSGRVSRAEITVGNLVGAGVASPALTTVVSVSPVYVSFEVDEQTYIRYAANGAVGNSGVSHLPVSIGLASEDGYPHQGQIKAFDNRLDTASGTMRVRAVFDNQNGALTPGMYARVRTGGSAAETAVLIDDKAVGNDQDKKYVMVLGADNKVTYRPVKLGPIVDGLRVVRSGLKKDERIVVNGLQRIRPNDLVTPVTVSMDGENTSPAKAAVTVASAK